ncbi:MAG: radical SAM protein [Candidatus ainarchaeum sp.]|nr:radical SAM protein [Candidatus ainarchaeum sp.]
MPKTIYLTINSVCNLKCKMCDFGQKTDSQFYSNMNKKAQLSLEDIKQICYKVKSFDPKISIISTEPTLHPQIVDIIREIKCSGLSCSITTNGFLLKNFAKLFLDNKLDEIWISLDGPPKIHNLQRGVANSYENAVSGIRELIDLKNKNQLNYPKININYTITPENYNQIKLFLDGLDFISEIEHISFSHINYITEDMANTHNKRYSNICIATPTCIKGIDLNEINVDELLENINFARKYKKISFTPELFTKEKISGYYFTAKFISKKKCLIPWVAMQIQSNGDCIVMTRCFDMVLGNILKQNLNEIWNGQKYKHFRKELNKVGGAFPACSRCCGVL